MQILIAVVASAASRMTGAMQQAMDAQQAFDQQ
jgi:hypothetical protein